jgi:acyl-CoA thioester hydrolase
MKESKEKTVEREEPEARERYPHFLSVPTRWMDNDVYGHVNNVVYYSYFDTVVNEYLIRSGVLDIEKSPVIGLVVETQCRFFESLTFPDTVHAGLRVARLGRRSVIGLFRNDEQTAAAQGHFVHVYVERESRKATALPSQMRAALEKILAGE